MSKLFEAILFSSQKWLNESHLLNLYGKEDANKMQEDLEFYSKLVHHVELSKEVRLINELQIISNLYSVCIFVKEGNRFKTVCPFESRYEDGYDYIVLEKVGNEYFPLV